MSSLTAMTILPQFDCKVAAPLSPRHTSVRGVLAAKRKAMPSAETQAVYAGLDAKPIK